MALLICFCTINMRTSASSSSSPSSCSFSVTGEFSVFCRLLLFRSTARSIVVLLRCAVPPRPLD